ncbi:MAG: aminoacetone oxidase family FAD-binding enzyme, partial [Ruminiclostridium sp.]|nr:aminoacetone oxidase family FAD-binding enzyme [Ruminiclostridium sp.]
LKRLGIEVFCDFPVTKIEPKENFSLFSDEKRVTAKAVILAGGGCSQSALGSDGSVLRIAKALGLPADPLSPALVPLKTPPELVRGLKGVRVNARVSLSQNGKMLKTETGEVQFGENTLSGICIFNLSLAFEQGADTTVILDLLPETETDEVLRFLRNLKNARRDATLEDYLTGLFHKRIGLKLLRDCTDRAPTEPVKTLSDAEIKKLVEEIKRMEFPILGTMGFEKSQVTKGGIRPDSLTDRLESKTIPRLFVCGEMLSYAGECGGYNLTFAFASGALAGRSCAEQLSRQKSICSKKQDDRNKKQPISSPAPNKKQEKSR